MAQIIDGKKISAAVKAEVAAGVAALKERGIETGLAVVLVGDDPASRIYVSGSASLLDSTILEGNAFLNRRFLSTLLSPTTQGASLPNFVSKQISDERVYIPSATANTLGIALAIVLPLALIAAGLTFFLRRRRL